MLSVVGVAAFALSTMQAASVAAAPVADSMTPYDRIVAATHDTSLKDESLKPWYLKLDVTIFDASGKNPSLGTIETWHSDKDDRTVYTFGSSKRTILNSQGNSYESIEGPNVPVLADFLLEEFIKPGPSQKDIDEAKIELQTELFGKVRLDCIMLTQTIKHEGSFPMGLFPTYCMDPGGEVLRASYNLGSYSLLRNGLGRFQGRQVATHISMMDGQIQIADAKSAIFTTSSLLPDFFKPESSLTEVHKYQAESSSEVVPPTLLTQTNFDYPREARQNRIEGKVVLTAMIGRDGHTYHLHPVSAPNTSLAVAAIQAVRQWTYKPALRKGLPNDVYIKVEVNFDLNL